MKSVSSKKLERALSAKGFRMKPGGNHKLYYFYKEGKKTSIRVTISNGDKEYSAKLLGYVRGQMKLEKDQFKDFVNCPMDEETYKNLLVANKHI